MLDKIQRIWQIQKNFEHDHVFYFFSIVETFIQKIIVQLLIISLTTKKWHSDWLLVYENHQNEEKNSKNEKEI